MTYHGQANATYQQHRIDNMRSGFYKTVLKAKGIL